MAQGSELISLTSICEGCLSVNRKLQTIFNDESRTMFTYFLAPFKPRNPYSLCWECTAIINRIAKFKSQVSKAQELLQAYSLHPTLLHPLSKLQTVINNNTQQITDNTVKHTHNTKINTQTRKDIKCDINEIDKNINSTNEVEYTSRVTSKNASTNKKVQRRVTGQNAVSDKTQNTVDETKSEPVAFIKVEQEDGDHLEGYFVDENEDKDLKAVLKSNPFQNQPLKHQTHTNSDDHHDNITTNDDQCNYDDDGFDDSDDEPLTMKKVKKGRRNNGAGLKEKTGVKADGRKNPGSRREKPSGVVRNARTEKKLQQLGVPSSALEMVVLSWEEVEVERSRMLSSEAFTRHEHRCYDCVVGFNHRAKLEDHMKKHTKANGSSVCSVCSVHCRDKHALCAHKRRHRVRWRCVSCGLGWSRAAVAADHFAREHSQAAATHQCNICGERLTTLGRLRNHLKNHGEKQKCELCGKMFRDRTSLKTHLFIHSASKEHACDVCGKRFLFKNALRVHMVTHDAHQHLYCHQCDMNFKNRMSFYQHMKYNLKHIDPAKLKYACKVCDKKFLKARSLEEHNLAVHLKVTPIRCTMEGCDFACSSRPVLRTHLRMVHRNLKARRNHVCHNCGKAYTTKKTLEGHLRTHTGERPLQCTICPATFRYDAALYKHNKLVHCKQKTGRNQATASSQKPTTSQELTTNENSKIALLNTQALSNIHALSSAQALTNTQTFSNTQALSNTQTLSNTQALSSTQALSKNETLSNAQALPNPIPIWQTTSQTKGMNMS